MLGDGIGYPVNYPLLDPPSAGSTPPWTCHHLMPRIHTSKHPSRLPGRGYELSLRACVCDAKHRSAPGGGRCQDWIDWKRELLAQGRLDGFSGHDLMANLPDRRRTLRRATYRISGRLQVADGLNESTHFRLRVEP